MSISSSSILQVHSIGRVATHNKVYSSEPTSQIASSTSSKRNSIPEGRLEEGKTAADSLQFQPRVESDCATRIAILRKAALDSMSTHRRPADGEADSDLAPPLKRRTEGHTDRSDSRYASKAALTILKSDSQKRDSNDLRKVADSGEYRSCDTAHSSRPSSREAEPNYLPSSSRLPDSSRPSSDLRNNKRINQSICSAARRRSIGDIKSICYQNIGDLDGINTATALHRIAQIAKATQERPSSALITSLIDRSLDLIRELNPQNLSNIAWALATLRLYDDRLMKALELATADQIQEFNPQSLSNTAWAFASLGIHNGPLMKAFALAAESQIQAFKPQELSTTAWAFASLRVYHDPLMRALALAAMDRIQRFNPQDITNMAWAFASLGARNDRLMKALSLAAEGQIRKFTPQGLSNTAWAFALFENEDNPLFRSIARELKNHSRNQFNASNIQQLLQAQSALKLYGVDFSLIPTHWNLEAPVQPYQMSKLQQEVGSYLKGVVELKGRELRTEYFIPELDHCIDFVAGEIAFEVDGPSHFAFESENPLGHTLFRNRLLRQLGWKLVCIPYWEWNRLDTTEKQRSYLNQKIEEVLKSELSSTAKPFSSN